jgi:hypothetical protein
MHEVVIESDAKERLSDALRRLQETANGGPLAVQEMVEIMRGRGLYMMLILLCLPFLSPVAIPGISLPFGLAIALCGMRIAFGHEPWLPDFIMKRQMSYHALERMVRIGCAAYEKVEKIVRPRLGVIFDAPGMMMVIGGTIALAGILLSLPIPPPFPLTNTIPGFAIIFFALGLIERDGVLIVAGYVLVLLAVVYFAGIAFLGKAWVESMWQMFTGN